MATKGTRRKHIHHSSKKHRDPFDYVVYFFMVATPLFELPQLLAIWTNRNAENVSLLTWAFFCVDNIVWMIYGYYKKQWPIFFTSAIYSVFEIGIVVGIILFS